MPKKSNKSNSPSFGEARLQRDKSSNTHYEQTRYMWMAAKNALLATGNKLLDREIAEWLAYNIDEILSNRIPEEMALVLQPGGIKSTPLLKQATNTAAMYRQAVASGAITDKAPIRTLAVTYGCSEQTIYSWIRQSPKDLWVKFRPSNANEVRIKYLKLKLKHDAKLIRLKSQTQNSIENRG